MRLLPVALATLATSGALASGACSLLISGETEQIQCSEEGQLGPPACDPGFSCQAGVCRADAPSDDDDSEALGGVAGAAGSGETNGAGGAAATSGAGGASGSGETSGAGGAGEARPRD